VQPWNGEEGLVGELDPGFAVGDSITTGKTVSGGGEIDICVRRGRGIAHQRHMYQTTAFFLQFLCPYEGWIHVAQGVRDGGEDGDTLRKDGCLVSLRFVYVWSRVGLGFVPVMDSDGDSFPSPLALDAVWKMHPTMRVCHDKFPIKH